MRHFKIALNGAAQFVIGSVGIANDVVLKAPGFLINEASNVIGASLDKSSDAVKGRLVNAKKSKPFAYYMRNRHNKDLAMQKVFDGREKVSDFIDLEKYNLPKKLRTQYDEFTEMLRTMTVPNSVVTDEQA